MQRLLLALCPNWLIKARLQGRVEYEYDPNELPDDGRNNDVNIMPPERAPSEDDEENEQELRPSWGKRERELIANCYETLCSWPLFLHLVMTVSLVWVTGFIQYNYPLVVFAAIFYLHRVDNVQKERLRIQIQSTSDQRRSRMVLSTDAETVTWLNSILHECWPAWLERYLSHLIMNCLHLNLPYYKPKALSKLVIDYLRLGSSPPTIQSAKVSRNLNASRGEQAILDLDISFVAAEDMRLELIARLKKASMGLGLAGKLYGNNLRVEGKLRLGLKFVPFYPYLGQLTIAFASVPILGLSVRPLSSNSVDVTDLPGIASWVSGAIQAAVETFLVEPHPLVVDMIKLCGADYRFDIDKDGTFSRGNMKESPKDVAFVILEILECKDLECKDRTGFIDPYVKITLEKVKFKTSIKKQTVNPIWHELFRLRINSWGTPCRLILRVRDRDAFGKDDELGCCLIDISKLRGGKRHDMWVRLHGVKTGQIHVAATVVDIHSKMSVDYEEGGSGIGEHVCACSCSTSDRDINLLVDDSVALRANLKMRQVRLPSSSSSSSCIEHQNNRQQSGASNNPVMEDHASPSYSRPRIKHVRVASVDSDRLEGSFDFKGHPILERETPPFVHGPIASAATGTVASDLRAASALPSVAEKVSSTTTIPQAEWDMDGIGPSKASRKRRTFLFLKPRKTTPVATCSSSMTSSEAARAPLVGAEDTKPIFSTAIDPALNPINSPKSHSRINLKSFYKRMA